ncbi:MAG: HAD family hydrolase [Marinibacterium sp.]|nr:HAD family hydrolase [Marinibacterium sp.]
MTRALTTIGFDADDTLWHNERVFRLTQDRFAGLLRDHADADHLMDRLLAAERRNLGHYGYGVKGFVLSMIETALEVTAHRVPGEIIAELMEAGREMLSHPIDLLPHVHETLGTLSASHRVIVITKGDLLDQERKIAQSGLGDLFAGVEIVSEKTAAIYEDIFDRLGDGAARAMMVGNSMRSDVRPAIEAGGWGVYVPHALTWDLEQADPPTSPRYHEIPDLSALPALIGQIET